MIRGKKKVISEQNTISQRFVSVIREQEKFAELVGMEI